MESYIERWNRERREKLAQERKPVKKSGSRRKAQEETQVREETRREEETQDGTDNRSEGHETP